MGLNLPWFRFYVSTLNNSKVQSLTDSMFRGWVNMLCCAATHDGILPGLAAFAFELRITEAKAKRLLENLLALGLIDRDDAGELTPHAWDEFQYVSDSSTERVRKHREKRSRSVTETPSEQSRTEQNRVEADETAHAVPSEPSKGRCLSPQIIYTAHGIPDLSGEIHDITEKLLAAHAAAGLTPGSRLDAEHEIARALVDSVNPHAILASLVPAHALLIPNWRERLRSGTLKPHMITVARFIRDGDYRYPPAAVDLGKPSSSREYVIPWTKPLDGLEEAKA